jgi:hypothetical protein
LSQTLLIHLDKLASTLEFPDTEVLRESLSKLLKRRTEAGAVPLKHIAFIVKQQRSEGPYSRERWAFGFKAIETRNSDEISDGSPGQWAPP